VLFPTATGRISRLVYARARETGIELKTLLKKAQLNRQQIEDRGARVNVHHQIEFLNLAANALRDDFLGLHLAQSCDLRELGLLYYVTASSEKLTHALERAARYSSITNEGLSLKYLRPYPLPYDRIFLTLQRLFQSLYLIFVALDHPLPLANQMVSANHTQSPVASPSLVNTMLVLYSDSTRYGGGIRSASST
jgi:AraC-type transcriptional regulator